MADNYIVDFNTVGKEDLYVYDSTLYDIIQGKIILKIKKPIIFDFWRRTDRYAIGVFIFCVSINPNLQPFVEMKTSDEKINFVKNNWKDFVRIALANLYPKDIVTKLTDSNIYDFTYKELYPVEHVDSFYYGMYAYNYFRVSYPELKHVYVYNGYNTKELVGYYEIPEFK